MDFDLLMIVDPSTDLQNVVTLRPLNLFGIGWKFFHRKLHEKHAGDAYFTVTRSGKKIRPGLNDFVSAVTERVSFPPIMIKRLSDLQPWYGEKVRGSSAPKAPRKFWDIFVNFLRIFWNRTGLCHSMYT